MYEIALLLNGLSKRYFGGSGHSSYFTEVAREISGLDEFIKSKKTAEKVVNAFSF